MVTGGWRWYALLAGLFAAARLALHAAGVRFDFSLDWMWLADPADLRERLLGTVYYYHAFPPGMNLLTGVVLKAGGAHAATLAAAAFWVLGLTIALALFSLCRTAGLSAPRALAVALSFSLLPQTIYFEQVYLYEYPVTALLLAAAVLFHAASVQRSVWPWLGFFLACSAIGLTRSTFHLVWFGLMVALALWAAGRSGRRRVLLAAAAPAVLLLGLYVKNLALFGTFDAFTFGPVSQNLVTTWRLPPPVREAWIADGTLSRFAAVNVYAGPREYLALVAPPDREWPRLLTDLDRRSVQAPNYNHWLFLEVNRTRRADALRYVAERPMDYAATAALGLRDLFAPTTTWHPLDAGGGSPHEPNRAAIGSYESAFNQVVHGIPIQPVGIYLLLPAILAAAAVLARRFLRGGAATRPLGTLLVLCLVQIGFVAAASSLFTFRESSRYRFQVEPLIWVVTAACLANLTRLRPAPTIRSHLTPGRWWLT